MNSKTTLTVLLVAAAPVAAQDFGNEWLKFSASAGSLQDGLVDMSTEDTEVDFAWTDVDKDGDQDLVVVRKESFTSFGKRTNFLLLNEDGILIDRTAEFATASDVPGDQGFLTPTNDRDVYFGDFDGDGWEDFVTATTLSDSDPKEIGHPRIYMNLGEDGSGNWLGFEYQAARIPQMFQFDNGNPVNPRFCSVTVGDVTGDGHHDIYFGDYDSGVGAGQPPGFDMNNRLLVNDGNGFFTDESQTRMSPTMLLSAFGAASVIADMNGDGVNDVLKQTALAPPQHIAIVYNNPNNEGVFNIYHDFMNNEPYHVNAGHLNQDGRLDIVVSSDGQDRYRYNQGNDAFGRVIWSPAMVYTFLADSDDGFASNNIIVDLDNDGWGDTIHADVDVDIPGGNRRIHIYHNPGGETPDAEPVLVEEREAPNFGWIGAVGIKDPDLRAGHDIAPMDLDNDGDKDLIIGRMGGLYAWINQTVPNYLVQDQAEISLSAGGTQNLIIDAGRPNGELLYLVLGSANGTTPALPIEDFELPLVPDAYFNFLLANPNSFLGSSFGVLSFDGTAQASLTLPAGTDAGLAGLTLHHALVVIDGAGNPATPATPSR